MPLAGGGPGALRCQSASLVKSWPRELLADDLEQLDFLFDVTEDADGLDTLTLEVPQHPSKFRNDAFSPPFQLGLLARRWQAGRLRWAFRIWEIEKQRTPDLLKSLPKVVPQGRPVNLRFRTCGRSVDARSDLSLSVSRYRIATRRNP